ncbi:polyphosphate kinase 1 [Danxiaibacter flavus]|uniref:Polyphosphate kinase n=1 Tax=Danxiaibacter flavus TaxID=3049108 RepID=A0ABV3ZHM0_9BACT|nr:polyphosphate kinase 1 [Chitinophagaceae bacterium DXS]
MTGTPIYFNRDISWLSFNARVLDEAAKVSVPLMERIRFLSIYSSNLDEFYRVRIPALLAVQKNAANKKDTEAQNEITDILNDIQNTIQRQQEFFGKIFLGQIQPLLAENNIELIVNKAVPEIIRPHITAYFFTQVLAFLQPVFISTGANFFPENNRLYMAVILEKNGVEQLAIINIPSVSLPRFYTVFEAGRQYVVFLDDIINENLQDIFPTHAIKGAYNFKVTRDAELFLDEDYEGDIAELIERQLSKRDLGFAARFLYQPGIPLRIFHTLVSAFRLNEGTLMQGGNYHNLKDLAQLPLNIPALCYDKWPAIDVLVDKETLLLRQIEQQDIIVHTPYQTYNTVLRFFNEASINEDVREIYVTLYRIADDSKIANALISAAKNGKKVTVFVELKARFDEGNNIRWSKLMKAAGIQIVYSIPSLKVHAKVALVKKEENGRLKYSGLLATGNFNESTARFYTDHILFTSHKEMLRELELIFIMLLQRKKRPAFDNIHLQHLLVARVNMQERFLQLIDREISFAKSGIPAEIIIKLNNLEERVLIDKLYEASKAGVKIRLIVRSICCIVPGISGLSENITVTRIVDRYLEHGRLFIFNNNGDKEIFIGSADWMNRNIYHRVEVCFPIYDTTIKNELLKITYLQLNDNAQAVTINSELMNVPVSGNAPPLCSQKAIYDLLSNNSSKEEIFSEKQISADHSS